MNLVCLLEEPSAKEMLTVVLQKVLPAESTVRYIIFQGRQDLEKNVQKKLQGYQTPQSCFLVMCDQDAGDCKKVKQSLQEKVTASGKANVTCIRIACRELESFYLGDLQAVAKAFDKPKLAKRQKKEKFRNPDRLHSPARELETLTGTYQKIDGSRKIAPHLKLDGTNTSQSFNALLRAVRQLPGIL